MMAARDLSVITTPPPNRYPIETQVVGFNEELIRDAISYEIQRNGQVFFINNRIENIKEIAGNDSAFGSRSKSWESVTVKWTARNWKN